MGKVTGQTQKAISLSNLSRFKSKCDVTYKPVKRYNHQIEIEFDDDGPLYYYYFSIETSSPRAFSDIGEIADLVETYTQKLVVPGYYKNGQTVCPISYIFSSNGTTLDVHYIEQDSDVHDHLPNAGNVVVNDEVIEM